MRLKRIISFAVALVISLSLFVPVYSAEENTEENPVLSIIGLEFGITDSEKAITRIDLARIALMLSKSAVITGGSVEYVDIPKKHWAFDIINSVSVYGYMSGYSDDRFAPNDSASVADAAQVFLMLLGYGEIGKASGWQTGTYLIKARSLGLLKGVDTSMPLNKEAIERMAVNMLDIPIVKITTIGVGTTDDVTTEYSTDETDTYLTAQYGFYSTEGLLQAVGESSVSGSSAVSQGYIKVDGIVYNANGADYSKYLGYTVKVYLDSKEENAKVLYLEPYNITEDDEFVISSEDIIDYDDFVLSYYTKSGRKQTVTLPKTCQIVLNGQEVSYDERYLTPLSGSLKLVDANGDGDYELVHVTYVLYFETAGVYDDEYIKDSLTGRIVNLEDVDVVCTQGGKTSGISSVENGTFIAVMPGAIAFDSDGLPYPDNDNMTRLLIETEIQSTEGVVNVCGQESCSIDNAEYEFSKYLTALIKLGKMPRPVLGSMVKLYFDLNGKVTAVSLDVEQSDENRSFKYGYLLAIGSADSMGGTAELKIFTEDGEMKIFKTDESLMFNKRKVSAGAFLQNSELYSEGRFKTQLITYKTSTDAKAENQTIKSVETAADYVTNFAGAYEGYDTVNFSYDFYSDTNYRYNFAHLYTVDENSIVFVIPRDAGNDKKYKVQNGNAAFSYNSTYDVKLYDAAADYSVKAAVLDYSVGGTEVRNLEQNMYYGVTAFLVGSVDTALDEDGMDKLTLTGITYDAPYGASGDFYETSLIAQDDELEDTDAIVTDISEAYANTKWKDLKPGDVIHYSLGDDGMVERFRVLFKRVDFKKADGSINYRENSTGATATTYLGCGKIYKILKGGNFIVSVSEAGEPVKLRKAANNETSLSRIRVYLYYEERGMAVPGTLSDLREGDGCYFRSESGILREVIVYK